MSFVEFCFLIILSLYPWECENNNNYLIIIRIDLERWEPPVSRWVVRATERPLLIYYYYLNLIVFFLTNTNQSTFRSLCATKYSFSFTSSDKFWTKLTIICQACFHIMIQKMTGLVELNFQWELYIFTHLFSSTGL